jgi:hypothetical protein
MIHPRVLCGALALAVTCILSASAPARAERPDCEAVHSAVQAELDATCPCEGAESHGKHVQCVSRKLRALSACETGADGQRSCGPVPRTCVGKIRRVASRSACGRDDAVTCCLPKQHDCTGDSQPGDGKKDGTCSDSKKPCDALSDCLIPKCQLSSSVDHCRLAGGTVGNGKNCRNACK